MANPKRLRSREDECQVDRISLLPDELLVSILGLLSFKEAAATSILGRRWRYLHTWTRMLDLDGNESLRKLICGRNRLRKCSGEEILNYLKWVKKRVDEKRCSYIKWVDHIITQYKSPILEEFRLCFNLDRSNSQTIDKWLQFALSKKVEKLDLNLNDYATRTRDYHEDYIFPYRHFVDEFKFLKKLSTLHANISGEFVKGLIHNCPLLEFISLTQSNLTSLEIIKPFPSLKILEICLCHDLESLVIRDSNLVTLKVNTSMRIQHVVLENVPLLTEFWSWPDNDLASMTDLRRMFFRILLQLCLLKLIILFDGFEHKDMRKFCSRVKLSNLKQLVIVHRVGRFSCLPHLIKLIKTSPRLERVVMEFTEYCGIQGGNHPGKMEMAQSAGGDIRKKYPHLKEMKIVGYRGLWHQFEMLMHFVNKGAALQNIVVDTRFPNLDVESWDYEPRQTASRREILDATHDQLRKYVPSRIDLHVI